jgi:predicted dehydrogenase
MSDLSRRQFLEDSMFAAAALAAGSANLALGQEKKKKSPRKAKKSVSPGETLSVAVIGVHGQGNSHLGSWSRQDGVEVTYICDADEAVGMQRVEEVAKRQGRKPKFVQDFRKMLEDKSVDLVSTATPNHWHALVSIWAMQAGKDVYVEKPVSHNVSEGRRMVETARKHGKICQTGTQCRSMGGSIEAIEWVKSGKIGEVKLARGLCYKSRGSIGPKGQYEVPKSVSYDMWLGPAPMKPPARKQFHYDWHWFWDYGCGDLGNQGIHQMDIARWGLGVTTLSKSVLSYGGRLGYEDAGETANTQVIVHDYGDKTLVFEVRGLKTGDLKGARVGVIFQGSTGYVVLTSYESGAAFDLDGKLVKKFNAGGDHFANFLTAVRSRKFEDLHADVLQGHLSSALCHTGNISYRLGEQVAMAEAQERLKSLKSNENVAETFERFQKHLADNGVKAADTKLQFGRQLAFDPASETFVDNAAANAMLSREYRAPFVVPSADKV